MGWLDTHLHEFAIVDFDAGESIRIGIPDAEMPGDRSCLPGWDVPITQYFNPGMDPVRYSYDFGDDWKHALARV